MAASHPSSVKVPCNYCGGAPRNHAIRAEFVYNWTDPDSQVDGMIKAQVCQCLGCEVVRFRSEAYCSEADPGDAPIVHVYPDVDDEAPFSPVAAHAFPEDVRRVYLETIAALNAGAPILAGAGLRAVVEAICKEQAVGGATLQKKIDKLVANGLLAKAQADLLHEERYLGNDALHELSPPSRRELELGLQIIEGLLNAIYVLPGAAAELQKHRAGKKMNGKIKTVPSGGAST